MKIALNTSQPLLYRLCGYCVFYTVAWTTRYNFRHCAAFRWPFACNTCMGENKVSKTLHRVKRIRTRDTARIYECITLYRFRYVIIIEKKMKITNNKRKNESRLFGLTPSRCVCVYICICRTYIMCGTARRRTCGISVQPKSTAEHFRRRIPDAFARYLARRISRKSDLYKRGCGARSTGVCSESRDTKNVKRNLPLRVCN